MKKPLIFNGGGVPSLRMDVAGRTAALAGWGHPASLSIAVAIWAVTAGCTMAPRYERPALPVANAWSETATPPPTASPHTETNLSAPDIGWEEFFGDPRLKALIRLALENNRDLRVAVLNVEQVRAQYRIVRLAFIPDLNAEGSINRSKTSSDVARGVQTGTTTTYSVGVDIPSYEIDFFGRVRSLRDQALESFLATEEARRTAHLALVAEVATQYLNQRAVAEELRLTEDTLKAVEASFKIADQRYRIGASSRLDLTTAEAQVQRARADVSSFRQQLAQADNALMFLVGRSVPADLPSAAPLETQGLMEDITPGLPSDLLQRRPDILQAEHVLEAANANIGAARAAFFPKITLTAGIGSESLELSRLFTSGTGTWNFIPSVTLPIFAAGKNRAALDVANLQKQVEIARYEQAIQNAFREVSDALIVRSRVGEQIEATDALVKAQQKRYELTQARYKQGAEGYLAVLLAQQDLFAAQQSQIRIRLAKYTNLTALYRALGGGWIEKNAGTK